MSDPKAETKKHTTSAAAEVDWAERLKASMSQTPDESSGTRQSSGTPTESAHEDDLAALLRAQLGRGTESTLPVDLPDTSDFEEPEEEYEEDIDEEYDEDIDEEYEEDIDEDDYDELIEDDYDEDEIVEDDYVEESAEDDYDEDPIEDDYDEESAEDDYDEDPIEDDYDEESIEEDYDEDPIEDDYDEAPIEDDYDEESIEDDYDEDPIEDDYDEGPIEDDYDELPEEESSIEISVDDYDEKSEDYYANHGYGEIVDETLTQQILDKAFDEEFTLKGLENHLNETEDDYAEWVRPVPPPSPAHAPTLSYNRPLADAWTDDRLNGIPLQNGLVGDRLSDLARENHQLILETGTMPAETYEEPNHEEPDDEAPSEEPAPYEEAPAEEAPAHPSAVAQIFIPLQLGLDDISSTVAPAATDDTEPSDPVIPEAPPADYTDHMAESQEEDALNDTDLYLRLGYEDTLRRTDEQMRVEELGARAEGKKSPHPSGEIPSVRVDEEYRGREDSDRVEEAYARARRRNMARLILAATGAFVGIFYDLLPHILVLADKRALENDFFDAYAPVGLVWTLLVSLPFLSRLGRGVRSLLDFEPTRYALPAAALAVSMLHGVATCVVADPLQLPLFGGVALLMLTIAALAELLVTEGEYRAFTVASSGKTTHILTDEFTPSAAAARSRQESSAAGAPKKKVFTVVRAGRVADYFTRTQRYNPYMGRLNYLLPVGLLIAICCAGLEIALGGDILTDGLRVFTSAYLICLPSAYLLAMTLPLLTVNNHLAGKGTAILGTAAPADYAGKDNSEMIFPDGDGLRAVYRKDVTLRGDARSEECTRMADVVFRLLQTPLAVDPVIRETVIDHYRIEISETDEQYMRLYLVDTEQDTSTEIMMGSHAALTRRGVRLPKINMEQRYKKSEGSHVLYLAFNREFHLAYAVEYRVGRTFARAVSALNDLGYEVSLSSFDPLVDPAMDGIQRLRKRGRMDILRPTHFESVRRARSSGVIATGRSLDLVHPLNACRAMLRAYRREYLAAWLSLVPGVALSVLAVCLGGEGLLISATVALWQMALVGVSLWISLASAGKNALIREPQKPAQTGEIKSEQQAPSPESRPTAKKDPLAAPRTAKKKAGKTKKKARQKHKRKQR